MTTYDLIVIGSGPAGQRAAITYLGCGKVALGDARSGGRACINTGTIPSKTVREAATPLRVQLQVNLWHELPREGKDHHGRSCLPCAARYQDRN